MLPVIACDLNGRCCVVCCRSKLRIAARSTDEFVPRAEVSRVRTNSINYFSSASNELIAQDFTSEQRKSFTITRDISWESETATRFEVTQKEIEFIVQLGANDPARGYNQAPVFGKSGRTDAIYKDIA